MKRKIYSQVFRTVFGPFRLWGTDQGLYSLEFGKGWPGNRPSRSNPILKRAARRISDYLKGRKVDLGRIPVDWSGYAGFRKRVLENLRKIRRGETANYQFLAARAGKPRAARSVGQILRLNRLPIILPCHRILPKAGGVGGFSKGAEWKKRLLKLEGASVDKKGEEKRLALKARK